MCIISYEISYVKPNKKPAFLLVFDQMFSIPIGPSEKAVFGKPKYTRALRPAGLSISSPSLLNRPIENTGKLFLWLFITI
jgi:hypothetical protein